MPILLTLLLATVACITPYVPTEEDKAFRRKMERNRVSLCGYIGKALSKAINQLQKTCNWPTRNIIEYCRDRKRLTYVATECNKGLPNHIGVLWRLYQRHRCERYQRASGD